MLDFGREDVARDAAGGDAGQVVISMSVVCRGDGGCGCGVEEEGG